MATTTSSALSRLRRRLRDSQAAYQKSTAASLNKYGKAVQKSFQEGLVSRANLIAKREERENKQRSLRERFTAATSNVLSRETLAMLHEHSKIAAPTLTSIFTGYESARADRADRFERLLDKREEGLERIQAADELAFRDAATQRQQSLTAHGNILNNGLATQKAVFASDSEGIATEARFANTEIEIAARQEEARRQRQAALELQKHRDTVAAGRDAANNKQALARIDKQIEAANERARIAAEKAATLAKQKAEADQTRFEASKTFALEQAESRQEFDLTRDKESRTFKQTEAEKDRTARTEAAKQEQTDAIAQIEARTAGQVKVKETLGAGTTDNSVNEPYSKSTYNMFKTGAFGKPASTDTKTDVPPAKTGTVGAELPAPEVVSEDPVVEGGTEPAVEKKTVKSLDANGNVTVEEIDNFGDVVPNADFDPDQGEAPGEVSSTTDYFTENLAQSDDPVGEATQLLSSVLSERDPQVVANLGEGVTFDQLAALVNEEDEEDERLRSVLVGIRNYRTTEVS